MKESMWGYMIITLGVMAIIFIWFFTNVTNTDQQNYTLLKESVEAAMLDSVDLAEYRASEAIKIDEKKFVENFVRRFAENASLANTYTIEIVDINEEPAKVSIRVSTVQNGVVNNDLVNFRITNNIDGILEAKWTK